jgi:hypothetical protein
MRNKFWRIFKESPEHRIDHFKYAIIGIVVAVLITILGAIIATAQGCFIQFFNQWYYTQGFFLSILGTWLILVIKGNRLGILSSKLSPSRHNCGIGIRSGRIRFLIILIVGTLGTISVNSLGFPVHGLILIFLWVICGAVCFVAGIITLHALDIIIILRSLQNNKIKLFKYSPASTPELRNLVNYYTTFTLLMTIAYAFSFAATLINNWTASEYYLRIVQLFWHIIYVPFCSIVLIYPHIIVHRIIKNEKEQTLLTYQREMDSLLDQYQELGQEQIQRTNSIAELFDRISATPDYVIDFAIGTRTLLPLLFNFATLYTKLFFK